MIAIRLLLFLIPLLSHTASLSWIQILPNLSNETSRPEVALFPDANGVAIWTESGGTILKGSSFAAATKTWKTPVTLSTSANPITQYDLSVSPDGFAMAVWVQPPISDPTSSATWASFYKRSDDSWTLIGEVENAFIQASDPTNAFIGNNLSISVWVWGYGNIQFSASVYSYFDVNTEMFIDTYFPSSLYNQLYPSVRGKTGSSKAIMLYLRSDFNDPATSQVESVLIELLSPSSNYTFISAAGMDDIAPTFSMNLEAQGICGWIQSGQIYVSYLTDFNNNTWAAPQLIAGPSGITTAPISAMDPNGTGAIAWVGDVMGVPVVQLSFFDSGSTTWSSPINVSNSSSSAASPSITVTETGRFGLVWAQNGILQSRVYEAGVWTPALGETATPIAGSAGGALPDVSFADGIAVKGVCVWEGMSVDSAYLGFPKSSLTLSGKQILYRYPLQGDLVNQLSWSATAGAASYKVFRDNLNSLIAETPNPFYNDHQRTPYQTVTYYVSSVDANGNDNEDLASITIPAITYFK